MFLCFFSDGPRIAGVSSGWLPVLGGSVRLRPEGVLILLWSECVEGNCGMPWNYSFASRVPSVRSNAVSAMRACG
jgi:hypothetical protein